MTDRSVVGPGVAATVLSETLRYAREREYCGWDYGDGMSSRILQALPVENKWLNIAVQESIKRSPVNLRPLALVEQRRNYKGTGLFAMANLIADEHLEGDYAGGADGRVDYEWEAKILLDWLVDEQITDRSGFCGGHRHRIQHLDRLGEPDDPDVVSTGFAVRALLAGDRLRDEYATVVESAAEFVYEDLEYEEIEDGARIKYVPADSGEYYTLNAVAIGARLLIDLYDRFGTEKHRRRARKLLDYVASRQTDAGGWYYRDPPDASHLSMDNHHNGFIVESLLRYQAVTGEDRYADTLGDALPFYRDVLFEPNGAPNWDEDSAYPKDIHAAATGIVTFVEAGDLETAARIIAWTLTNLYAGNGRFYYRKHRFYTKRFTLMRWCQGWMAYALARYVQAVAEEDEWVAFEAAEGSDPATITTPGAARDD